jgi:ribose transport system substrate-binding protein
MIILSMLMGCTAPVTPPPAQPAETQAPQPAQTQEAAPAQTQEPAQPPAARFDPDNEKDSINWDQLEAKFGPMPKPSKTYKIGSIMKFMGNPYWKLLAKGMEDQAKKYGLTFEVQAAQSESDQAGQLANMETMIEKGYDALLISPQTDTNLIPAVEKARKAGILLINVDDAVLEDAEHFIGPNQYENGINAAKYFIQQFPDGGKVAVIEGQAGVYAAKQRTKGFKDTLQGTKFEVVASVPGDWDRQKSLDAATTILQQYPDLKGFYCNNDTMALGVVEAVKNAGKMGSVLVIGTDGIGDAYDSIRADEMTGTVDSFPELTGNVAVDVALRLLEGQKIPRAVFSPQNLIIKKNIDNPLESPFGMIWNVFLGMAAPVAGN